MENEHLLLALLEQENGIFAPIIERIGTDPGDLAARSRSLTASKTKVYGGGPGSTSPPFPYKTNASPVLLCIGVTYPNAECW